MAKPRRHVVMFSGGAGSWAAAKRVAEQHGTAGLTLLFTDTLIEDADLYRFLVEAAADVFRCAGQLDGLLQLAAQTPTAIEARRPHLARVRQQASAIMPGLVWIADGRTPWDVFRDSRFLGNTRVDLCSRVLKRELSETWLRANRDPADTTLVVGIDWTEEHRYTRMRDRWTATGWTVEAPLCDAPYVDKTAILAWLGRLGIAAPRLYALGFSHNNCGGGCVKAGLGHFAHLLRTLPDVYATWEREEAALAADLGKPVTILRDRTGGATRPLTLGQLRERIEAGYQPDLFDIGGCGCFVDDAAEAA